MTDRIAEKAFPIGAAAKAAGLPVETIRIWERRYGLLRPARSDGGHRLYSQQDVLVLRAVKDLVAGGARVSAVARLTPARILADAAALGARPIVETATTLIDEVIAAARTLDPSLVEPLLDRPLMFGHADEVVLSLYLPLLQRVGDLWHAGEVSVDVEHFVEKLVSARTAALLAAAPRSGAKGPALLACPAGERHEGGLLAAALLLRRAGAAVTYLGGDLPTTDLVAAAGRVQPTLVVLAITVPLTKTATKELVAALERAPLTDAALALGGGSARAVSRELTRAHKLCARIEDVVALLPG